MKILCIWESVTGVEYHRIIKPLCRAMIDAMTYDDKSLAIDLCAEPSKNGAPDLRLYDLVIFNRWLEKAHTPIMEFMIKNNVSYVIDIDDYWKLDHSHPVRKVYKKHNLSNVIPEAIEKAAGVTVSTPALLEYVKPLNKHVCVIPNALDTTDEQWNKPKEAHEKKRVAFIGGATHKQDLNMIREAVEQVRSLYDVDIMYGGYTKGDLQCEEMCKRLTNFDSKAPLLTMKGLTPNDYGHLYTFPDVCLAPLVKSIFNNCKSDIKLQEALAYNLPIVCSDSEPFAATQGAGVFHVTDDTDSWVRAIGQALDFKGETLKPRSIVDVNKTRLEFYSSCLK